jgi:hypothetical protein
MTVLFSVISNKVLVAVTNFANAIEYGQANALMGDKILIRRATRDEIAWSAHVEEDQNPEPELSPDDIRDMMVLKDIFAAQHPH